MNSNKSREFSLVKQYDDIVYSSAPLMLGYEDEFLKFVNQDIKMRQHVTMLKKENEELKSENFKLSREKDKLEIKLKHTKYLLETEIGKKIKFRMAKLSLERQISIIKEVLLGTRDRLNDDTKEKLAFLHMTGRKYDRDRLLTVGESSGLSSSEYSIDQLEEDLNCAYINDEVIRRPSVRKSKRRSYRKYKIGHNFGDGHDQLGAANACSMGIDECDNVIVAPFLDKSKLQPNRRCLSEPAEIAQSLYPSIPVIKQTFPFDVDPVLQQKLSSHASVLQNTRLNLKRKERRHAFVNKIIIRPENCCYCSDKIKFYKPSMKCEDCRITCHPECKSKIISSCRKNTDTIHISKGGKLILADFTYHTSPMLPEIIVQCTDEIETRGLREKSLYIVTGDEKEVRNLWNTLTTNKCVPCLGNVSVSALCSVVKKFFSSLEESLMTQSLWSDFVECVEYLQEHGIQSLFNVINRLPHPNKDTLAFLILHLHRVAQSPSCDTSTRNLAEVFGSSIVGYSSSDRNIGDTEMETKYQSLIMEHFFKVPLHFWENILLDKQDDTGLNGTKHGASMENDNKNLRNMNDRLKTVKGNAGSNLTKVPFVPSLGTFTIRRQKKYFISPFIN